MKRFIICFAVAVPVLLAACGGGGGGSSNPQTMQNLQSVSAPSEPWNISSTTLAATDNSGNSYSLTISSSLGGMAMFNGQMASTSVLALTLSKNGTVVSTENTTAYYLTNPYSPLGLSGTTNGVAYTEVVTSFTPFPATLTVGSSGPVSSGNYEDSLGNIIGSLTETYTVTADSPSALFVNINASGTLNGTAITETLTYSITNTGQMAIAEVQITVNGTTLTFH